MSQFASAMAKSLLQPAANGREWRVVGADGSLTSFRDTRTMGAAGLEIMEGLRECDMAKPHAAMPASADRLGDFVLEARKTGLYQRVGQMQEQEAQAAAPAVKRGPRLAELPPPHVESIAADCTTEVTAFAAEENPSPLLAAPQRPFEPKSLPQQQPPPSQPPPSQPAPLPASADPNLARVVEVWPELPLGIQAGILAMVEATIAERAYTQAAR